MLLAAGGISLLLKLLVIFITDGETTATGLAAVFLLAGAVLLVTGFGALAWWLVRTRHVGVRIVAAVAGVLSFFVLFSILDTIGKNFAADTSYWQDEIGILLTAILALGLAAFPATRSTVGVVAPSSLEGMNGASVLNLGLVPYREAWELQRTVAAERGRGRAPDTILLLEHPPTVTTGRRTEESELHIPEGADVELVETDRGGKSTFHGPGQLVCYPILDLNRHGRDVKRYCRDLEEALIRTLARLGRRGRADRRPDRRLARPLHRGRSRRSGSTSPAG